MIIRNLAKYTPLWLLFTLKCLFAQPVIEVEPDSIDFNWLIPGREAAEVVRIGNSGDEQLIVTGVEIDNDAFSADYGNIENNAPVYFEYNRTDVNHSVLIFEALWDDEPLAFGDEIGVFDPRGNCSGATIIIHEGARFGLAAWGAEEDDDRYFRENEEFEFRYWDPITEDEAVADAEFVEGDEVWHVNGLSGITLSAEGGSHRGPGEMFVEPDNDFEVNVFFHPAEEGEFTGVLSILSNDPENDTVEVYLSGLGIQNDPPVWTVIFEEFELIQGEFLEFFILAEDPDGDEVTLEMDPDGLPENAEFDDLGDGEGEFFWEPDFDDIGEYAPIFIASDSLSSIEAEILILVHREPPPPPELPDQEFIEDQERTVFVNLRDFFENPDGDEYAFMIDAPEELQIELDDEVNMSCEPIPDFWVTAPGLEVRVTVIDEHGMMWEDVFAVTVLPLNDPPLPFGLLLPEDNSLLTPDSSGYARFSWEESLQNEYEADSVHYSLSFAQIGCEPFFTTLTDSTSFMLYLPGLIDSLGGESGREITLEWLVIALDDSGAAVAAENGPFRFNLLIPGVNAGSSPVSPESFRITSIFPNPFNEITNVRVSLPDPSPVSWSLFTITGNRVMSCENTLFHEAGWWDFTLDTDRLTAGTYLLRVSSANGFDTQKLVVLK